MWVMRQSLKIGIHTLNMNDCWVWLFIWLCQRNALFLGHQKWSVLLLSWHDNIHFYIIPFNTYSLCWWCCESVALVLLITLLRYLISCLQCFETIENLEYVYFLSAFIPLAQYFFPVKTWMFFKSSTHVSFEFSLLPNVRR